MWQMSPVDRVVREGHLEEVALGCGMRRHQL